MKYTLEIDLDVPRDRVIELFDSRENLQKWQPDLIHFDHVSGEAGQVGARSRLQYTAGKRQVEMIETITGKNLPDEVRGTYEAKGVWNEFLNRFSELSAEKTRWVVECEFRCGGWIRLMAFLMPGTFKKTTYQYMVQFKEFAEWEYRQPSSYGKNSSATD